MRRNRRTIGEDGRCSWDRCDRSDSVDYAVDLCTVRIGEARRQRKPSLQFVASAGFYSISIHCTRALPNLQEGYRDPWSESDSKRYPRPALYEFSPGIDTLYVHRKAWPNCFHLFIFHLLDGSCRIGSQIDDEFRQIDLTLFPRCCLPISRQRHQQRNAWDSCQKTLSCPNGTIWVVEEIEKMLADSLGLEETSEMSFR